MDIAKDRADWLLVAIGGATQNRMFLRGDPEYDEVAGEAILLNGEKAIRVALSKTNLELAGWLEQSICYVETLHSLMSADGRKTPATMALMVHIKYCREAVAKALGGE